ncbi:MAG: response regulator [Chthoniobacteraceae bacterium]
MNAITSESDPTLEIRTLIEQLQHAAREARTKTREAEQERDDLCSQLERALIQIDELRSNERELRSHFTEITTILRERDEAMNAAERHARTASRAQEELAAILRQRDETQRQRDEAFRQRDETLQRLEGLTRAYSETGMRSTEVQKQIAAIRQARDSAHAQIVELSSRTSGLEDQIAELEYQREAARKAQKQVEAEASEYRRQLDIMAHQYETAARQVEQLTSELDEQRKKFLDLAETKAAALQVGNEHAAALAEVRAQVASLAQERDAARLLEQAQARELEKIRSQFHTFREQETESTSGELAAAREKLASFESEVREARNEGQTLRQQLVAMQEKITTLEVLVEDATAHQEEAEVQLIGTTQQFEADRIALHHARQQIEEVTRERNSIRAKAEETRLELEAQLAAARTRAGETDDVKTPAADGEVDPKEMQKRFERQRLQSIELAARLEEAQQQIREMSASLAEARLQIKFAGAISRGNPASPAATTTSARPAGPQLGELLPAMRQTFEPFSRNSNQPSLLVDLHGSVVAYAERARTANCIAVHRLAQVFANLLEALAASPDQLNASTVHTIGQTIEFLATLSDDPAPERFKDPSQARVYVVDDDPGNCQCVQLVMEEQMIQATTSEDPSAALLELASETYDLVFLDINMPHMDGFELCQRLRGLSHHAKTPVVFLTGLATAEKRTQSLMSGGNDFLAKPFNLHELTVKAMTLIIRSQVEAA